MKHRKTHLDRKAREQIAFCIREVEARTTAEVVLVVRRSSGSYRDVSYLSGLACAFLALVFFLFSPWEFRPLSIPLPVVSAFLLGAWITDSTGLAVRLASRKRRRQQVVEAARISFMEKGINGTRERTGILLYCSLLERRAEIIPDTGALRAMTDPDPAAERLPRFQEHLLEACGSADPAARIAGFLRTFGVYLGRILPAFQAGNPNEIPDEPDFGAKDGS